MKSRAAPRVATWLLERFGGGSRCAPLVGDLLEQFEAGRSRVWYWRQAAGALAIELARTLRLHAFSFVAAIATGCAFIRLWDVGCSYVFQPLYENLPAVSRHPWTAQALLRVLGLQLHGFLGDALLLATAWVVTRIHRAHPRAVIVALVAAVTAPYLPGVAQFVIHAAADSIPATSFVSAIVPVALQAVCTLVAGLWVVCKLRFTEMDRRTRFVAVVAPMGCVLFGLAHRARLVGELTYTLHESYVFAALNLGGMAYLALLLWRPIPASRMPEHPPTHVDGGRRAEATKSV